MGAVPHTTLSGRHNRQKAPLLTAELFERREKTPADSLFRSGCTSLRRLILRTAEAGAEVVCEILLHDGGIRFAR